LANWSLKKASPLDTISISSKQKQQGVSSLLLHHQTTTPASLEHVFVSPKTGVVSVRFWDNMDTSEGTFISIKNADETQNILIGVNTNVSRSEYVYRTTTTNNYIPTHIVRSAGWHQLELISTPRGSYGKIDGTNLAYLASNDHGDNSVNTRMTSFQKIIIASGFSLASDAYYDNLVVSSLDPLPTTIGGRERVLLRNYAADTPNYQAIEDVIRRTRAEGCLAMVLGFLNQNSAKVQELIRNVAQSHSAWTKDWRAPLPAFEMGFASWLSWGRLDSDTKSLVENVIAKEADYWASVAPGSKYVADSDAESNSWTATFLSLAANMFPQAANATKWEAKARLWAFHSLTIGESYGGLKTETLYTNYLLDNHGYHPDPGYAIGASIGGLADGALMYKKAGKPIPSEFKHNVLNVWNTHRVYINFDNYLWQNAFSGLGGKDDWGSDATNNDDSFAYIDLLSGTSLLPKLSTYEYYIMPTVKGNHPLQDPGTKYLLESVGAKKDLLGLLFSDDSLKLDPVLTNPLGLTTETSPVSGKSSDFNSDGKVNLDDYKILISQFGNPYTIFDYNELVTNFNK